MRYRCLGAAVTVALQSQRAWPRMASVATSGATAAAKVSYVTDVEGNLDFWRRFCAMSEVVEGEADDDLRLRAGCHLVFGGDAVDKAPGDLRFLRSLLTLKHKYPENVHLILGNRDINKMRLLAELSDAHWLPAAEHPGVYWRSRAGPDGGPFTPAHFLASQPDDSRGWREDTRANRLRYMLADNMGSPRAFEFRREELRSLRRERSTCCDATAADAARRRSRRGGDGGGGDAEDVSDDDVLGSYLDSLLRPDGLMRAYLQNAQLALRLGDVLIVHGGAHSDAIGFVPGAAERYDDVDDWVAELNSFGRRQVRAWCADADSGRAPSWPGVADRAGEGFFDRPGGGLLSYGMATRPDGSKAPTVVYASYLNDGHPQPARAEAVRRLTGAGIRAVVAGHQPHGDSPVVMRCEEAATGGEAAGGEAGGEAAVASDGLFVITADTSFSGSVRWTDEASASAEEEDVPTGGQAPPAAPPESPFVRPRGPPPSGLPNPRGQAVVEVCLYPRGMPPPPSPPPPSAAPLPLARLHGVLSDGRRIDCTVSREQEDMGQGGPTVGEAVDGGRWWVKGRLADGSGVLLSKGKGYDVTNVVVQADVNKRA